MTFPNKIMSLDVCNKRVEIRILTECVGLKGEKLINLLNISKLIKLQFI